MPKPPAAPLPVTVEERRELIAMSRSVTRPHRVVVRAKGLLLAADGVANAEIGRRCEVSAGRGPSMADQVRGPGTAGVWVITKVVVASPSYLPE